MAMIKRVRERAGNPKRNKQYTIKLLTTPWPKPSPSLNSN